MQNQTIMCRIHQKQSYIEPKFLNLCTDYLGVDDDSFQQMQNAEVSQGFKSEIFIINSLAWLIETFSAGNIQKAPDSGGKFVHSISLLSFGCNPNITKIASSFQLSFMDKDTSLYQDYCGIDLHQNKISIYKKADLAFKTMDHLNIKLELIQKLMEIQRILIW